MFRALFSILFLFLIISCKSNNEQSEINIDVPSNLDGETLAKLHCSTCHKYVDPNMLDKETWEHKTLPEMGMRLGIGDVFSRQVQLVQLGAKDLQAINIYPSSPKINEEDYKKIVDFYLQNSIDSAKVDKTESTPNDNLEGFNYQAVLKAGNHFSNITAIGVDEVNQTILVASPMGKFIELKNLETGKFKKDSLNIPGVFSVIKQEKGEWYALDIGMLGPHERKLGKLLKLKDGNYETVLKGLHKPSDFLFFDINEDGVDDIIVCNFGFETGSLAWYDGKTGKENSIKDLPGARNVVLEDMDKDGKKDLVVLFAQAWEGISVFYNKGKGRFEEKEVLSFSPVFGSSWFQLVDMNQDGHKDILYVNGDNADYSVTLKKYHGVRIFENNGKNDFKQVFFYPLYGATKAIAADFSGAGRMDIAAIAYYRHNSKNGFVYLKNNGQNKFNATTFKGAENGQWITIETADVNGDNKPDILLGGHDLVRRNKAGKEAVEMAILLNEFKK